MTIPLLRVNRGRIVVLIAVAVSMIGCQEGNTQSDTRGSAAGDECERVVDLADRLEAVPAPLINETDPDRFLPVSQGANAILSTESDPAVLAKLWRALEERRKMASATQNGIEAVRRRSVDDTYSVVQGAILDRLAALGSDASAEALVCLLYDDSLIWDGGRATEIGHAITVCGERARPYLAQRARPEDGESLGHRLLQCIDRGELYGP